MVYCQKCGKKNDDEAEYCNKCGTFIRGEISLEKRIEDAAEELGRKAEAFGKHVEKKAKEFAESMKKPKQCPKCKVNLNYNAKFCWKCGNKV